MVEKIVDEMFEGNFSFLILFVGIVQTILMIVSLSVMIGNKKK